MWPTQLDFIFDEQIYHQVIRERIPAAKIFVWIATADIKNLHVHQGKKMVPFLKILSELMRRNIHIRLIHAKEPGISFRKDFDRFPLLFNMERLFCPRVHFKTVVVDGNFAYLGSANLTGAGMGAKSKKRRNFENGIITEEQILVSKIMDQFDGLWIGKHCPTCDRTDYCDSHKDMN